MGLRALLPDAAVFVAPHVFAAFVGEVAAAGMVGVSVDRGIACGNHALHFYVKARGGGDDIGLFHDVCLCLIDKMMMRCCWAVRSANDDLLAVDDVEALLGLLYAATTQVVGFHLVLLVRVDALDDRYLVRDEAHTGHLRPGGYGQIGAEAADVRAIELAEGYLTGRVVVCGILVPCGLQGVDGTLIRRFGDGLVSNVPTRSVEPEKTGALPATCRKLLPCDTWPPSIYSIMNGVPAGMACVYCVSSR